MTSIQGDFFSQQIQTVVKDENAPQLDIEMELLGAINYALRTAKQNGFDRDRIVKRMNLCLDKDNRITKRQLNGWTALSQEHRDMPAKYLPAFMWACLGVLEPLKAITSAIGMGIASDDDQHAAEIGYSLIQQTTARDKVNQLKKQFFR